MDPEEVKEVTVRDELSAAFDKAEAAEPKDETPAPSPEPSEEKAPAPEPIGEPIERKDKQTEPQEEKAAAPTEGRRPKAGEIPPKAGEPKAEEKPTTLQDKPRRAPGTWKPAAREEWAKVPPTVQQEILRREAETARGLNEANVARRFHEEFTRTVSPYQPIIAVEGGDPMKFVGNLLTTAAAMYHGTPSQKVNVVAGFIKNFGVDIAALDTVLAENRPAQGGPQDAAAFIRQEIQAALAPVLRGQNANMQQAEQKLSKDVETFATDPKNEFFEDVRETMADLLEVAARRGQAMDLQTAYRRATMMHSDIADVITDRELRTKAASASATAQAARRKAVSVTGAPSGSAGGGKPDSLRGDIEAAIESLGGA